MSYLPNPALGSSPATRAALEAIRDLITATVWRAQEDQ